MAVKNRIRTGRFDEIPKENKGEGRFFLKLLVCAALVCGFMLIKDAPTPSGLTVSQFVTEYIESNTAIGHLADRLRDVATPVFGDNIANPSGGE